MCTTQVCWYTEHSRHKETVADIHQHLQNIGENYELQHLYITYMEYTAKWGTTAYYCPILDTETAGQREARIEANAAEWHKATGLGDRRAAAVQT